ncbi:MAG: hypothetical protein WA810_05355 [Maribacter sp.]
MDALTLIVGAKKDLDIRKFPTNTSINTTNEAQLFIVGGIDLYALSY